MAQWYSQTYCMQEIAFSIPALIMLSCSAWKSVSMRIAGLTHWWLLLNQFARRSRIWTDRCLSVDPPGNNQSAVYRVWVSEAIHNKHVLYLSMLFYTHLETIKVKQNLDSNTFKSQYLQILKPCSDLVGLKHLQVLKQKKLNCSSIRTVHNIKVWYLHNLMPIKNIQIVVKLVAQKSLNKALKAK